MNFKNLKEKQGITLIALIITIIVLLILAGVSIAMLTGDNGILTRTKSSKQISEIAGIKEEIKTEIIAEQAGNEGNISESALKTILEKYGTINYLIHAFEKLSYEDDKAILLLVGNGPGIAGRFSRSLWTSCG